MPLIASVAVAAPIDKPLSYLVPEALRKRARVGVRLQVPLGRRTAVGFLLALEDGEGDQLKAIGAVLDEQPLFPPLLIPFFQRVAEYYCHPLGMVIRTALPAGLSSPEGRLTVRTEPVYTPTAKEGGPRGRLQGEILELVRALGATPLSVLRGHFSSPHAPLQRLVELGWLLATEQERPRDPFLDRPLPEDSCLAPTVAQQQALERIGAALDTATFAPLLLQGVTGSGKTEVYLRAIAAALQAGRQALVLVPEIALTPQLVSRFRARFRHDAKIAVLHSGLSDGERYDAWRAIAAGKVEIVIGARSAVFAPLPRLGMLVVDEEHEGSYKQGEGFRYHARDLALLRGQMEGAVVLLGSATPALATYYRAEQGQIGHLVLPDRARAQALPAVELVDLTGRRDEGILSPPLAAALQETLERGEQALLLLNRRGFSPFLLCPDCGATFRCPNCEITLTYYQGERKLRCHYCDHALRPPERCPGCQGDRLRPEGAGTERLEEELVSLFPAARLARMDRDTTGRKGSQQRLVEGMEGGEIDILFGTQMVAKGHDFPGVTLVGVVGADSSLNLPDFRSAERTFSLLTQVAGRAGRGERPGRVLIQTYAPDHYALTCAAQHDYLAFYQQEIAFRRQLGYPPFGHLVNLVFSGNDGAKVTRCADILAARLQGVAGAVEILGPAPCPLARLRGRSRVQILLKAAQRPPLRRLLQTLKTPDGKLPSGVSLMIDVDPLDML